MHLEDFLLFDNQLAYYMYVQFITNLNQFLLDWGLGQVVFATD